MPAKMEIELCHRMTTLSGNGRRRVGFYRTAAAAEKAARELAQTAAASEAERARDATACPDPKCADKILRRVTVDINSVSSTSWSPGALLRSMLDLFRQRHYEGRVAFTWEADLTCQSVLQFIRLPR